MSDALPRIGITMDNEPAATEPVATEPGAGESGATDPARLRLARPYVDAVADAGGLPIPLPHRPELAAQYVALCDAVMLTGGDDPTMEPFGAPTHPRAKPIDAQRQAFELALLDALEAPAAHRAKPALGICLGMQLMALHAGGALDQHLPDTHDSAAAHQQRRRHALVFHVTDSILDASAGDVVSHHRQAVRDPGRLRTVATAPDGIIEAVDAPRDERPFYLGVQWHPERGGDDALNRGLIARLVHAARGPTSAR